MHVAVKDLLADLYNAWHAAEPDPPQADYDAEAAEWQGKLPEENGE